jgi:hypothetical protein
MVSVSGALAQQESISISQNQRISYRRRMEKGEFITCSRPFGYRIAEGKKLVVDQDEAKLVRWIYQQYLSGCSSAMISEQLTKAGVTIGKKNEDFGESSVNYILTNEKYVGDSLCQKKFSTDCLPFTRKMNKGTLAQYYVEHTHPAIISEETFQRTQALMQQRAKRENQESRQYRFTKRIRCGKCGSTFVRRESKNGYVVWCCQTHDDHASACPIGRISEQQLWASFTRVCKKLAAYKEQVLIPALSQLTEAEEMRNRNSPVMIELNEKIAMVAEQNYQLTQLQAKGVIDLATCASKQAKLNETMIKLRAERRRHAQNELIGQKIEAINLILELTTSLPESEPLQDEVFEKLETTIEVLSTSEVSFHLLGGIVLHEKLEANQR